jgi:hypothetical protein
LRKRAGAEMRGGAGRGPRLAPRDARPSTDRGDLGAGDPEIAGAALGFRLDEAALDELREVAARRLRGDVGAERELSGRARGAVDQRPDDPRARRVRQQRGKAGDRGLCFHISCLRENMHGTAWSTIVSMTDLDMLLEANLGYIRAVRESDVAWFEEHLARDFVNSNPDGPSRNAANSSRASPPPSRSPLRLRGCARAISGTLRSSHGAPRTAKPAARPRPGATQHRRVGAAARAAGSASRPTSRVADAAAAARARRISKVRSSRPCSASRCRISCISSPSPP